MNGQHIDMPKLSLPMNDESELDYERVEELLRSAIARAENGTVTEGGSSAGESDRSAHAKVVREQLCKMKLKFLEQEDADGIIFCGAFRLDCDQVDVVQFGISVDDFCVESTFDLPIHATRERFGAVAEFCARVNHLMRFGKLLVDFVDGEISFRMCFSPAVVIGNPKETVRDLINLPKAIINTYVSGIVAVLDGENPHRAYKTCDPDWVCDDEEDDCNDNPTDDSMPAKRMLSALKPQTNTAPTAAYSLEGLNVIGDVQLSKIVEAVRKFCKVSSGGGEAPRLNILLSGPSGCGKTEFVKYLGREVGVEVMTISASDILSPRVGVTEQNLAKVFRKARESKSIVFFGEVDSLLASRVNADQSWEVTQVNELLQQMERFDGIMIGATNLAENLDRAVLRRFTYKLKLDYLTDEGKDVFYRRYFGGGLSLSEKTRLSSIENLTPGDFRTVCEKLFYLSVQQTNAERLAALEAESEAKGRERARIGFSCV